jgi:hypothetical protein
MDRTKTTKICVRLTRSDEYYDFGNGPATIYRNGYYCTLHCGI